MLVEKGERGFADQVDKVVKTWERNKAPNAEACVGQQIRFRVNPEQKHIIEQMATLEKGETVVAGGAHRGGDVLLAVEVLVKAFEFPALQAKFEQTIATAAQHGLRVMQRPQIAGRAVLMTSPSAKEAAAVSQILCRRWPTCRMWG